MKLQLRSYVMFFAALLVATYGSGQVWRLAADLRAGSAGPANTVAGALGALALLASAVVLARFIYVLGNASRSARERREGSTDDRRTRSGSS